MESEADWWRRLTILDPLSGRFALGLIKSLANAGDRAGALSFARAHERLVRRDLETDPDPEIRRLEAELRALPSPSVTRTPAKPSALTVPSEPVVPRTVPALNEEAVPAPALPALQSS